MWYPGLDDFYHGSASSKMFDDRQHVIVGLVRHGTGSAFGRSPTIKFLMTSRKFIFTTRMVNLDLPGTVTVVRMNP